MQHPGGWVRRLPVNFFERIEVPDGPAHSFAAAFPKRMHGGKSPPQAKKFKVPEHGCRFSNQSDSELGVESLEKNIDKEV